MKSPAIGTSRHDWPKGTFEWIDGDTRYISVPFTWNLNAVRESLRQPTWSEGPIRVGGPAVDLMPDYLASVASDKVRIGGSVDGALQRVNPLATRTTVGCPWRCSFCGIGQRLIEGDFRQLDDWPNLPIICDNNLLYAARSHFERVIERLLSEWNWCDFNQGLDATLLTTWHAELIAKIPKPIVRMALDSDRRRDMWRQAFETLRAAGIAKKAIRTYVLVGFDDTPEQAWEKCRWVESFGVMALPQWFHPLDAQIYNAVTRQQHDRGWTDGDRKKLMAYFYQHRTGSGRRKSSPRYQEELLPL